MLKRALIVCIVLAVAVAIIAGASLSTQTVDITIAAHGKPTAGLAGAGAGNVTNGDHLIKVGYVSSTGVSTLSTASDPVTVADKTANGKINVTLVASADPTVTGINIYATEAAGSAYYKVNTSTQANSNATYVYNIADATLITQGAAPTSDTASAAADTTLTATSGYTITQLYLRNNADSGDLLVSLDGSTPTTTNAITVEPNQPVTLDFPARPSDGTFLTTVKMRFGTGGGAVAVAYSEEKR